MQDFDRLLRRLSHPRNASRVHRVIQFLLVLGLIVLGGWAVVEAFMPKSSPLEDLHQRVEEIQRRVVPPPQAVPSEDEEPSSSNPGTPGAVRNIFGAFEVRAEPTPRPTPVRAIPVVPLDLVGTFIEEGAAPYAIIEHRNKKVQDVFMLQDSIFGAATLRDIQSDRVRIERNGQLEELLLDIAPRRGAEFKDGVATRGENEFLIEEAEIDRALENLPQLLTQARAVPYFKDGQAVGLRLFAIRQGSLFEKIGLRNGDILKSINDSSLGDLTQAMKLFERLKTERNLTLMLERDRQEREFRYSIR